MKKEFKFAFVLMLLLLLVGCGAKDEDEEGSSKSKEVVKDGIRATCSQSTDALGMKMNFSIAGDFKKSDDSLITMNVTMEFDYSGMDEDFSDDKLEEGLEEMKKEFEDEYGKTCDGKVNNGVITISCDLAREDIEKITDEDIKIEDIDSVDKFIASMEKDDRDMTCTKEVISLEK